ncbi:MAG: hypothetical protein NTV58_06695 [Deltaproteobacteria bacterium]|nr:hypothetical protein [Deltaproteobacteria bacterium]
MNKSEHSPVKKGEATRSRQRAFVTAYIANRFSVAAACRIVGIGRTIFYKWRKSSRFSQELADAKEERLDVAESCLHRNIQSGDTTAIIFFLKTQGRGRGYIEATPVRTGEIPPKRAVEILDQLISGIIDITTATLQFTKEGLPLPRSLEILLSKIPPPPEPPPELPPGISDEELEAGYQRKMAEIDKQKEDWVPERQAEVQAIKDELKGSADTWGPTPEETEGIKKERGK